MSTQFGVDFSPSAIMTRSTLQLLPDIELSLNKSLLELIYVTGIPWFVRLYKEIIHEL